MFLYLKCEGNKTLDNFARNIVNPVVFLLTLGGGGLWDPPDVFKRDNSKGIDLRLFKLFDFNQLTHALHFRLKVEPKGFPKIIKCFSYLHQNKEIEVGGSWEPPNYFG